MSVAARRDLPHAARRLARRTGVARWRGPERVPRLRAGARVGPPTVWMVAPDWDRPAGGIRKEYRTVDVLNAAGLSAAIVHDRPGFSCSWFEHDTRVVSAGEVQVAPGDVIAVPEVYGASITSLPRGVAQVIFNQNAYLTLDALAADGRAAAAPYVANPDLAAVTAVSEHNADLLRRLFPGAPVRHIRPGIDPALHHPGARQAGRRIAYMTRRRSGQAAQVLALLEHAGALADWEVVAIDGRSEAEVAEILRGSLLFLSFSELEGLGLPPLEALACGCAVAGFDGFAGREFFRSPFAVRVEDGDVAGFARAVEGLLAAEAAGPGYLVAAGSEGARYVADRYSLAAEREDLIDLFGPLLRA